MAFVRTDNVGGARRDGGDLATEQVMAGTGGLYRYHFFSISLAPQRMTHFDEASQELRAFKLGTRVTLLACTSGAGRDLKPLDIVWQ